MSGRTVIIVHGGAGPLDAEREPAARAGCAAAARAGLIVLTGGGSAVDAVQAAVRVLEDDPQFNAGLGAALTREGTVELDASIMSGADLRAGAIGAVPDVKNPIDLARAVMDDGEHVLLVGGDAWDFARGRGFTPAAPGSLITERARRKLAAHGTVGACALDAAGHVAAATSTGGTTGKRRGRVGDTPLVGCGTYADDAAGAASATGHGEKIIRVTLTRALVDRLRAGEDPQVAAAAVVASLGARVAGDAGVICVDRTGRVGLARNTAAMPHAWASDDTPEPVTGT